MAPEERSDGGPEAPDEERDESTPEADDRRAADEVAASPAAGVVDPDLPSPPEPSEPA